MILMRLHKRLLPALVTVVLGAGTGLQAGVLWQQPTDLITYRSSQNDTNANGYGNFATTYDNFTLGATSTINSVDWVGVYFNPTTQGTITAWTLQFYADSSGTPGGSLYSLTVPGTASETFLATDNNGSPAFGYSQYVNFTAVGGTQYWLSVVPDLGFPPQWGWESASGGSGDGNAYQVFFGAGAATGYDVAFTLNGTAAPEPVSILLVGTGFLLLGVTRRTRRISA